MPYKSKAQQAYFHTDTARKNGITPSTVNEFDQASKGLKLPDHVKKYPVLKGRPHIQRVSEK